MIKPFNKKLLTLLSKEKKIAEQKDKLIERRKCTITNLLSQFDLLTASDELLAGVFSEVQSELQQESQKVKEWEDLGARFQYSKRQNSENIEAGDGA